MLRKRVVIATVFRYVGHGGTRTQISGEFEIGSSTASKIVREVAAAIIDGETVCTQISYENMKYTFKCSMQRPFHGPRDRRGWQHYPDLSDR